jgi:hypothetical protein
VRTALAVLSFLLAGVAHADKVVNADGVAVVQAGDEKDARTRALDEAFRRATAQLAHSIGDPRAIAGKDAVFQREILRRARTYVVRFKVRSEGPSDAGYKVQIEALLSEAKLGADLELHGLARAAAVAPPTPTPAPPAPAPAGARPPLALVLLTSDGTTTWATFGKSSEGPGPASPTLVKTLEGLGYTVRLPAGVEVPVIQGESGSMLLDDAQVAAATSGVSAGGALYGTAQLKDGGRIRGTAFVGVDVELALAAIDSLQGTRLWEGRVVVSGYGADPEAATAAALRAAEGKLTRQLGPRLATHWPPVRKTSGAISGVEVVFRGVTRWPALDAAMRTLATVPGVKQVTARRFAPTEVTLLCEGSAAPRAVADALATLSVAGSRFVAKSGGGQVNVDVVDAPPADPLPPADGSR